MIDRDEVIAKARDLDIHEANVQRDYVFGWLIGGLYTASALRDILVLKGGNALRKAYFPMTRFSGDLDFSTTQGLSRELLLAHFNDICRFAEVQSGVKFDLGRNQIVDVQFIDPDKRVYKMRLYFRDFSGTENEITLKVKVDVVEHDRIYLPIQTRRLIHPYSDAEDCNFQIRVVKLEEALADKMRCLLQRRYSYDLFDLVYAVFINRDLDINRKEAVATFLRKTIFEPSPVAARNLLLGVPYDLMRGFWGKVICPRASRFSFDQALALLRDGLVALFEPFSYGAERAAAYFRAELRNQIMDAGNSLTLLRLTYDGVPRLIEPYSLAFKRRRDGAAQEYLYAWDRSGGRSGEVGIRSFLPWKVESLANTDEKFEPRFEVEISRAGDRGVAGYFGKPFSRTTRAILARRRVRLASRRTYKVQCPYCGKVFSRQTSSTSLRPHTDGYGNRCYGKVGIRIF